MAGKGDHAAARGGRADGAGGPRAADGLPRGPARGRRWLARLAFAAAAAAVVVLLLFGGLKGIAALLLGSLGLAVGCAAAWVFLAYRGVVRWLALVVVVAALVFVIVVSLPDCCGRWRSASCSRRLPWPPGARRSPVATRPRVRPNMRRRGSGSRS